MLILVTYDVATLDKAGKSRLRKVARACEDYGQRVQNSVFEIRVGMKNWILLKARLLSLINPKEDSLRFYFLDKDITIEHYGTKEPINLEGPLIL